MRAALLPALRLLSVLSVATGLGYPLAVTALAHLVAPHRAAGSPVTFGGKVVGCELVGQPFAGDRWFHGRPSATVPAYDGAASAGSNLGPTSPALLEAVEVRLRAVWAADPGPDPVPVDLVTASGSGLDPHVSPAAAHRQVARVARARGWPPARVAALVEAHVEGRTLGVLGEPRVNVLRLNLALETSR